MFVIVENILKRPVLVNPVVLLEEALLTQTRKGLWDQH